MNDNKYNYPHVKTCVCCGKGVVSPCLNVADAAYCSNNTNTISSSMNNELN